jgi:putative membrane protein
MSEQTEEQTAPGVRRLPWRRILVLGVLLPVVAAWLLIWSATGRESNIDRVPVAIVNNDTIITDPQPMAAGRSLTAALTHPSDPSNNLLWVLTDSDDARAGLENGSYYAVLTIPSDFSQAVLSTGTDTPAQGQLRLVSNAAASTTMPYISQQVATAAADALGQQVTEGYLGQVYDGFNSLADGNQKAATSAAQLADGTQQLSAGAAQLDEGAESLSQGLGEVATGSDELAEGASTVNSGAVQVANGTAQLAQGVTKLTNGQASLAAGTRTLAGDAERLAARSRELARGARVAELGTRAMSGGARLLSAEMARLGQDCQAALGSPAFCKRLARAVKHSARLAEGARRVSTGPAAKVASGASQLADGAGGLARGSARVSASAHALSGAGGRLSASTATLVQGTASLAQGTAGLDSAAGQLASGTRSTAEAGSSLASGSSTLASSASQADDGAQQLSGGLASGAAQSPTYSDKQQQALTPVVSEPVVLTSTVQHNEHGNGWLIAVIVGLVLWLAALVAALSLDLSPITRNSMAPVASRAVALAQSLPLLGLAALSAASVVVAVVVFHTSTAAIVPLALLVLLASATFALLALAMRLRWGRVGITLFVLFLLVQIAASSNVVPLETAPGVLQTLNGVMPLTAFVNGASQLVSGGAVGSFVAVVVVLLVWALTGYALLVSAVKKRRMLDPPEPGRVALSPV